MNITDYHAKYFTHELTKRCSSDSLEKLAGAVAGAQVDLNPHQVDAALFAFNSPLSKGALIADEVGLGKTIEAGLVISQEWAERKRRILIIVPSNLRKQWYQELAEKFFLPCQLLETKSYNAAIRQGNFRPFEIKDQIVICSYQFARKQAADVANTPGISLLLTRHTGCGTFISHRILLPTRSSRHSRTCPRSCSRRRLKLAARTFRSRKLH